MPQATITHVANPLQLRTVCVEGEATGFRLRPSLRREIHVSSRIFGSRPDIGRRPRLALNTARIE